MKTIIITRAIHELDEEDFIETIILLNSTDIIKVCVNYARYNGDIRLFHDYYYLPMYEKYPERILVTSSRILHTNMITKENKNRIILYDNCKCPLKKDKDKLWFRSTSLTSAIDLCYSWLNTDECLLLATNKMDANHKHIMEQMKENVKYYPSLYSYKEDNNFNLKYKSLKDFIREH